MSISTLSLNNVSRTSILRIQNELRDATTEANTGRHADVGATLGRLTGTAVTYRAQESSIARMQESNKLVASRMEMMDDTLTTVSEASDEFGKSLISGAAATTGTTTLMSEAKSGLQQLTGSLNLNVGGQYLFAGTQSDIQPISDGSAAVTAGFEAFLDAAGPAVGTPATRAGVTDDQLKQYFSTAGYLGTDGNTYRFDDLFDDTVSTVPGDTSWDASWSNASSDPAEARISRTETIQTSLSANETAFRKMTAAYSMVATLGIDQMNDGARKMVLTTAAAATSTANKAVIELQAELGTRMGRVETANKSLTKQQDIVKAAYERLEGVDETEAALRLTQLETQLETSYAITGKLQGLSILDYI